MYPLAPAVFNILWLVLQGVAISKWTIARIDEAWPPKLNRPISGVAGPQGCRQQTVPAKLVCVFLWLCFSAMPARAQDCYWVKRTTEDGVIRQEFLGEHRLDQKRVFWCSRSYRFYYLRGLIALTRDLFFKWFICRSYLRNINFVSQSVVILWLILELSVVIVHNNEFCIYEDTVRVATIGKPAFSSDIVKPLWRDFKCGRTSCENQAFP